MTGAERGEEKEGELVAREREDKSQREGGREGEREREGGGEHARKVPMTCIFRCKTNLPVEEQLAEDGVAIHGEGKPFQLQPPGRVEFRISGLGVGEQTQPVGRGKEDRREGRGGKGVRAKERRFNRRTQHNLPSTHCVGTRACARACVC